MTTAQQLQVVFQELDYLDDGYEDGLISHVGLRYASHCLDPGHNQSNTSGAKYVGKKVNDLPGEQINDPSSGSFVPFCNSMPSVPSRSHEGIIELTNHPSIALKLAHL